MPPPAVHPPERIPERTPTYPPREDIGDAAVFLEENFLPAWQPVPSVPARGPLTETRRPGATRNPDVVKPTPHRCRRRACASARTPFPVRQRKGRQELPALSYVSGRAGEIPPPYISPISLSRGTCCTATAGTRRRTSACRCTPSPSPPPSCPARTWRQKLSRRGSPTPARHRRRR